MTRQGKLLFAQIETSKVDAERIATNARKSWTHATVRVHPRSVRANGVTLPVWVVVARAKAVQS